MQFSSFIIALMAPLALAAPLRQVRDTSSIIKRASGSANIHNNCDFDIKVNTCADGGSEEPETIKAGSTWSQPQKNYGGSGKGVSLKINKVDGTQDNVAQFEYTVNDAMSLVFYDLSLINGNPFKDVLQHLTSGGAGPDVDCAIGEQPCAAAYTWAEQVATKSAPIGSDVDFHICSAN